MADMALRLAGKVALITGAASGIGRATARLFAVEGASLGILDKNGPGLREIEQEVRQRGHQALAIELDLAATEQIEGVIEQAAASWLGHLVIGRALVSHGAGSRPLLVVFACGAGLVRPGWAI